MDAYCVFKHPVMVLSFNNCELHCCSLDGYRNNSEALLSRLELIDDYFGSKPKVNKYRLWYNIDESILTVDIMESIAKSLFAMKGSIIKIAFIGVGRNKRLFDKILRRAAFDKPVRYFSDAEIAKEWLV